MATTSLSLLQTGYIKSTNVAGSMRFKFTKSGDMNNDGDMPINDTRDFYGSDHDQPIMIFDSSDFTGTSAAEVSSATLTTTIAETHTTNLASRCIVNIWTPATDAEYTLPLSDNYDIYDGDTEAQHGALMQGHAYLNPSLTTTDAGGASDYSYGGFTVHDLSSQDYSVGQTITFDVTAQIKAYFRNPHRVNNGQLIITLDFDGFSGNIHSDGISNSVHLHGQNGSDPPTLSMTYEAKTRTRVTLPTSALGSDFVWHGGSWKSTGGTGSITTVDGVGYQRIMVTKNSADSFVAASETDGFAKFNITGGEVTQGETLDAAILSFTARGQTGYQGADVPSSSTKPAKVFGDKSNSPSYPTSYSDLNSKPFTTAFVYDKQGSNSDQFTGNTRSAYQLDVTDIVNEIIANENWDGSAIQFFLKCQGFGSHSSYFPFQDPDGGGGPVVYPALSFLRSDGEAGGAESGGTIVAVNALMMPSLGDMD